MSNFTPPDDMEARVTEALQMLPDPSFWVHLTDIMRHAAEIDRLGLNGNPKYNARLSSQVLLHNLADLLSKQHYFRRHQDYLGPLMRLSAAAWDLNHGHTHLVLKAESSASNPGQPATHALIKGMAARAMDELIKGKVPRETAARTVLAALRAATAKGMTAGTRRREITWRTVTGWRDELNKGSHESESAAFRLSYKAEMDSSVSESPLDRGNALVAELRTLAASLA
jgi:hypothetical protein